MLQMDFTCAGDFVWSACSNYVPKAGDILEHRYWNEDLDNWVITEYRVDSVHVLYYHDKAKENLNKKGSATLHHIEVRLTWLMK